MGTPGDRVPINEIIHQETDVDESALSDSEQSEMTILRDIPSLGIFLEHGVEAETNKFVYDATKMVNLQEFEEIDKGLLFETGRVGILGLEDKLGQKSYGVMQELSLPGPSGLQTPKTVKQSSGVVPKRSKKPPVSSQTPKKPHTCSICNKNFQNVSKLITHQVTHSGGTPFKCEHCKKSFSSKFKLVRHVLIHSDRKPFSCTVCERTFHRKDHLKNHIKVHSPSKKIYTCDKSNCKKEYTSVMSYRKHLALHSAEEGGLECKICLKTFESKPEILYHLKIHAGSRTVKNPNEKKFTCDYCDRKFFTRKDVRRHLVVHTGTRNFLCQFCPQRFGRKDHLVRHIKKSHSRNYTEPEPDPQLTPEPQLSPIKQELPFDIQFEPKPELPPVQFQFTDLPPMLCSNPDPLQYLPQSHPNTTPKLLPSDNELLSELVVMKEEYEQLHESAENPVGILTHDIQDIHNPPLLPSDMIDSDILRLINEGSGQLSTEDENNLPLPGFSQAFQQPP